MIAHREAAELAEQLIADTIDKQNIVPGTLTLHADRGTSMRSKSVAQLLVDLDVTKTHSRPHVSDDNPYSEAQFKTLKYRPDFPARFGSIEDARAHCQEFFRWYNTEHRHSGIALMPPDTVHYGRSTALTVRRGVTLDAAFPTHPPQLLVKLVNKCVSSPLTCSGAARVCRPMWISSLADMKAERRSHRY